MIESEANYSDLPERQSYDEPESENTGNDTDTEPEALSAGNGVDLTRRSQ